MTAIELMDIFGPKLLKVCAIVAPVVTAAAPGVEFIQRHPVLAAMTIVGSGGTGANITARILNKIPLDAIFSFLESVAAWVSRMGNSTILRVIYQPFEVFVVKFIIGGAAAAARGLTKDDATCPVPPSSVEMQAYKPSPLQGPPAV